MHGEPLNISRVGPQQLGKDTTQKCWEGNETAWI